MDNKLIELMIYFILYSVLGWVMESIFRSICERKVINTGFLKGPFCPIYGIGANIMFLFLEGFENRPIILFFIAIIVLTAWEYVVGVFLEKVFHTKYWDYSDHKINFQGRICLTNSFFWGILGVLFVKYIHPFVQEMINKIDTGLLNYILAILFIVFVTDTIVSIIHVKSIKSTLENIEKINKEIKEKLKEIRVLKKEKEQEEKLIATKNIQQMVEKLKKKRNRITLQVSRNVHR